MKLIHNVHYVNSARPSNYSLKGSFGEPAAGSTSPSASTRPREFVLGGTLGRRLLILGLCFGALEVHFDVFLWPWGQTLDSFFDVSRKVSKKVQKKSEKGSWNGCISYDFWSFSGKCESAFRLRRRERIEVQAPDFVAPCFNFALPFLHRFFVVFGPLKGP